jgi:hypothetical protein
VRVYYGLMEETGKVLAASQRVSDVREEQRCQEKCDDGRSYTIDAVQMASTSANSPE